MDRYLCVIRQDENVDWYMLCVKDTMYCISSGCLETIERSIRKIKRRYKTVHNLGEALNNMSERPLPPKAVYSVYRQLYNAQKGKYDYVLEDAVQEERERDKERKRMRRPLLAKREGRKVKTVQVVVRKKSPSNKKVYKPIRAKKGMVL